MKSWLECKIYSDLAVYDGELDPFEVFQKGRLVTLWLEGVGGLLHAVGAEATSDGQGLWLEGFETTGVMMDKVGMDRYSSDP